MRLIDADNIVPDICDAEIEYGTKPVHFSANAIDLAPTVDAVPVVRCRECKHHRDKNEQEQQYLVEDILICTSPDATDDCWNAVWPDHFCSYGERKEGADCWTVLTIRAYLE